MNLADTLSRIEGKGQGSLGLPRGGGQREAEDTGTSIAAEVKMKLVGHQVYGLRKQLLIKWGL